MQILISMQAVLYLERSVLHAIVLSRTLHGFTLLLVLKYNALGCAIQYRRKGCFTSLVSCSHPAEGNSPFITGLNNWKRGAEKISAHENAQSHCASIIALTARKHFAERVDKRLIQQYESECEYRRSIFTRIVSVLRFITERGLALRGLDQTIGSPNNGNYLGCLELLSEYDPFLSEHIRKHARQGSRPHFILILYYYM